jgi:hypothetical protein
MIQKIRIPLLAFAATLSALAVSAHPDPSVRIPPDNTGGGTCSTTCAVQCSDGSWSSIACLSNEKATCSCSGAPVLANPRCSSC